MREEQILIECEIVNYLKLYSFVLSFFSIFTYTSKSANFVTSK